MTLVWLLLAAALALARRRPAEPVEPAGRAGSGALAAPGRGERSLRQLQLTAAVGLVLACGLGFGWRHGLVAALLVVPAGIAAVSWLHRRPPPRRPSPELALALDLVATALRAGQPLPSALGLAAPAAGSTGAELARVAGLLRLGADPDEAWASAEDPALAPVAAAARRSASSGVRLAAAFERLAVDLRGEVRAAAEARARRVEVLTAAPLGLCFLPAFVCLGIAPTVIGVAAAALSAAN